VTAVSQRVRTGLDSLLAEPRQLQGRRFALLAHGASVTAQGQPIHLALTAAGHRPAALLGPEHGYYGIEQDMVAAAGGADPWTGAPLLSLYGADESSLRPAPEAFTELDLLVIDLQDVGSRYYTYAATAVWAATAAATAGCQIWVLDRPNPLGGEILEGALLRPGFESFVSAFELPVRHGLTLAELLRLEGERHGWAAALRVFPLHGWRRSMLFDETGLPWVAPSPNMPTLTTALLYPGSCLIEATELSEGRGTTRPFQLVGAPHLDPLELCRRLEDRGLAGVRFLPNYFRPQFQKHAGEVCGGVEILIRDRQRLEPYRLGVELLAAARAASPGEFQWRRQPYEFVVDRPAVDLLTGSQECRLGLEGEAEGRGSLDAWIASWKAEEEAFRQRRRRFLLYPEESS
jgi:uncharacterized protein YbbC (DUF1343 family)